MNLTSVSLVSTRPRSGISRLFFGALALTGALLLAGCASDSPEPYVIETQRPAAEIFNEGVAAVEAGRYRQAIDAFEELDLYYPYSADARRGLILMAAAAYEISDYELAIESTERFLAAYPADQDADYALFLLGESYLRTVPDITRDQEAARAGLAASQELLDRFPNSQYAEQARLNVLAVRDQLAGQEMLVGRYYQERREYPAAINRFRVVVTDYDDTRHVEEALFRLTETYLAMGLVSEAQTAAAVLGHNFPASDWYERAYSLLGAGGLSPNNNGQGWLAQLFGG